MKSIKIIIGMILLLCVIIPSMSLSSSAIVMSFNDVKYSDWFYEPVFWCFSKWTMTGYGDGSFKPQNNMTRAEFVVTLGALYEYNVADRYAIGPAVYVDTPYKNMNYFTDVPKGSWYHDAVMWAYTKGYVSGVGNKRFNPNGLITRQEVAQILFSANENADMSDVAYAHRNIIYSYTDHSQISSWALSGMMWSVALNIIKGTSSTTLSPRKNVTRAEAATMIRSLAVQDPYFDYKENRGD